MRSITPGTCFGPYECRPAVSARGRLVIRALGFALLALTLPCAALGQAAARDANITVQVPAGDFAPGPEHRKLEIWLGDWTYDGEDKQTSFQAARLYTGKATVRPVFGGAFVEWQAEENNGAAPAREIDGYDPATKRFFMHVYYPNGSVEVVTYTMEGNTVLLSGTTDIDGKRARLRGTCVFAPDRRSFVEKLQVSLDGKMWVAASEVRFAKVR